MLTSKSLEILKFIVENNYKKNNIKSIAETLKLSERSIRYEIDKIDTYLKSLNLKGISLERGEINILDKGEVKSLVLESSQKYIISFEEREIHILLKILIDRSVNQKLLSQEMDLSLTTIKTHLKNIKEVLDKYNLKLEIVYKKGLELQGSEESIRNLFLKILNISEKSNYVFLKNEMNNLIFNNISKEGIKKFIIYCQKLMDIIISDEAYKIIKNYIKIMIYFNSKNHTINNIKNERFLSETREYKYLLKAAPILESYYDMEFSSFEYLKLTDYFLGSHTYNFNYSYYDNWIEIELIIKEVIRIFDSYIEENILEDKTLFEGLLNHIKPTIYRIKNGIELENSIFNEVIESYPELFRIAKLSLASLEEARDIKFTNDEVAFLVIHFKAAIDRNLSKNKNLKVLLVCNSGYGTSKLLAQQINQKYNVDIIDIIPHYMLEKYNEDKDLDLILSTIEIKDLAISKPIIKVNPFFSEGDLQELEKYGVKKITKRIALSNLLSLIKKDCSIKNEDELIKNLKSNLGFALVDDVLLEKNTNIGYVKSKNILLNQEVDDWKEAIRKAGETLIKEEIVTESYIKNAIKTIEEFGSYMVLAPSTIFPHAKTNEDVRETRFSILTSKNPVVLPNKEEVSTFILFCSRDNNEHREEFINLVNLFNDEGFVKRFKKLKKEEEVCNLIGNYY